MADKWPLANGNWSNAANWNGGTKPVAGDDVYADGRTVTIDEDVNIGNGTLSTQQRTGGTAGGVFNLNTNINVTANIVAGTTACVNSAATGSHTINGNITGGQNSGTNHNGLNVTGTTSVTINGNITGGTTGTNPFGVAFVSSGTLNIFGNVSGGPSGTTPAGVQMATANGTANIVGDLQGNAASAFTMGVVATATITGNVSAGSVGSVNCILLSAASPASITINGNVTGGSAASSIGVLVGSSGTLIVNGNATGGSGAEAVRMNGSGLIQINGTAIGGNNTNGAFLAGLGTIRATRAKGNAYGPGSIGLAIGFGISSNGNGGLIEVDELEFGERGATPIGWFARVRNLSSNICIVRDVAGVAKTLVDPSTVGDYPTNANVRLGTQFNFGNNTGTLAVPNPNQVAVGVATDNTVGTAVITEASLLPVLQQALSPNSPIAVERSIDDNKAITFSWPVSGATITGEKSVDNGVYSAVAGSINFLRSESGRHYYTLAYNASDRVSEEATIRYKMTDGTYTKYFNLRLVPPVDNEAIADQVLSRNVSNVESSAPEHSLATVVLAMLEHSISGNTLTIKRTDGTTTHYTKTLSTDAGANPITGIQ